MARSMSGALRTLETRPALTQLITANPNEAALYRLRAAGSRTATRLRVGGKRIVGITSGWPRIRERHGWQFADYYDRRHQPSAEIEALRTVGRFASDQFAPVTAQRSWLAFQRALRVVTEQALPDSSAIAIYKAWIVRYPQEPSARQEFVEYLIARRLTATAGDEVAAYKKAFPADVVYPVKAVAEMAADPLAVYDRDFQPLWPDELTKSYLSY